MLRVLKSGCADAKPLIMDSCDHSDVGLKCCLKPCGFQQTNSQVKIHGRKQQMKWAKSEVDISMCTTLRLISGEAHRSTSAQVNLKGAFRDLVHTGLLLHFVQQQPVVEATSCHVPTDVAPPR